MQVWIVFVRVFEDTSQLIAKFYSFVNHCSTTTVTESGSFELLTNLFFFCRISGRINHLTLLDGQKSSVVSTEEHFKHLVHVLAT